MTRELKILCGIPGSGKSYWAEQEAQRLSWDGYNPVIISRDEIRFEFLDANPDSDYFAFEHDVFKEFIREINECLELGIDYIFVDATNISPASRRKLLYKLKVDKATNIVFEVFETPLPVCLYRNGQREGREKVPVNAIKSMQSGFSVPEPAKEFKNWVNDNWFVVNHHKWKEE